MARAGRIQAIDWKKKKQRKSFCHWWGMGQETPAYCRWTSGLSIPLHSQTSGVAQPTRGPLKNTCKELKTFICQNTKSQTWRECKRIKGNQEESDREVSFNFKNLVLINISTLIEPYPSFWDWNMKIGDVCTCMSKPDYPCQRGK